MIKVLKQGLFTISSIPGRYFNVHIYSEILIGQIRKDSSCPYTCFNQKMSSHALASVAQLVGALSHKLKGLKVHSQSGHIPRLLVWSLVEACARGNWRIFIFHIDVSFPPFSLPPFASLKSMNISSGEVEKKPSCCPLDEF